MGIKECSSCGALYNRERCCSTESFIDNFVRDPNPISYDETSYSSQQLPRNCSKSGGPFLDGLILSTIYLKSGGRSNFTDVVVLYDADDDEHTIQYREYLENSSNEITPDLPTEEPDNPLSMGDEHPSTIPETKLDEVIKFSVEDLVLILSESEGISDDTYDMPFCDNSLPLDVFNTITLIFFVLTMMYFEDDDSFKNIDYVEASPPDSELVSL
ncbi:hypothetical protein Tco_0932411 [Tanacetum coccineum]